MSLSKINSYFESNLYKPFYLCLGDKEYLDVYDEIIHNNSIEIIRINQYCSTPDKKPNIDKFRETLRMADIDCKSNKIIVLGLGEYLALEGAEKAERILYELKDFKLGTAHVLFLMRGITESVKSLLHTDPRLSRQIHISIEPLSDISFTFSSSELNLFPDNGFKSALFKAECGEKNIKVNSELKFDKSTYPITIISDPFVGVQRKNPSVKLMRDWGSKEQWTELLNLLKEHNSLQTIFSTYEFEKNDYSQISTLVNGIEFKNWLFFIYMKINVSDIGNDYLRYVTNISNSIEEYKFKIINEITEISIRNDKFDKFYEDRKNIIKSFPEAEIARFVANNRKNLAESIYKLTDSTLVEKQEIIAEYAQSEYAKPKSLKNIYPYLDWYMKKYSFNGDALNDLLTDYFDKYKIQKIQNILFDSFSKQVDDLASKRVFNRLRTKDEIITSIKKENTFLCWIDALGVEYLSFIEQYAKTKGLSISVSIGRAELPTITSLNKEFYIGWPEFSKRKIEELDDIKHKERGGYKYGPQNKYAIHLAEELEIISKVIDEASVDLGLRKYDRYVIASDHGASRLAVLRNKEEKYETSTHGEHSGRCCKYFDEYQNDIPFATIENEYIVLADYGRFKKSRAANVEVHGGASLEEVIVPIITLYLPDNTTKVSILEKVLKADFRNGCQFTLFSNKKIQGQLSVEYNGKKYPVEKASELHYKVVIKDIKKSCKAEFKIFINDKLIDIIDADIKGKVVSMNSDFDDLF